PNTPPLSLHDALPIYESGAYRAEDLCDQVHRDLSPVDGAAEELPDQHRAERPRRVDGSAGRGRDRDDDREHGQADGQSGEPAGRDRKSTRLNSSHRTI